MAAKTPKLPKRDTRRQFAALPWRIGPAGLEVMLITSRETGRWVAPKGWPMKKKAAHEAAAQEAYEEAGVTGAITETPLGAYRYGKRLKNGLVQACVVDVYPLRVDAELADWPERDQRTRKWVEPRLAAGMVEEEELAALIEAFDALMDDLD